jgi:hypothetical protein
VVNFLFAPPKTALAGYSAEKEYVSRMLKSLQEVLGACAELEALTL